MGFSFAQFNFVCMRPRFSCSNSRNRKKIIPQKLAFVLYEPDPLERFTRIIGLCSCSKKWRDRDLNFTIKYGSLRNKWFTGTGRSAVINTSVTIPKISGILHSEGISRLSIKLSPKLNFWNFSKTELRVCPVNIWSSSWPMPELDVGKYRRILKNPRTEKKLKYFWLTKV